MNVLVLLCVVHGVVAFSFQILHTRQRNVKLSGSLQITGDIVRVKPHEVGNSMHFIVFLCITASVALGRWTEDA